MLLCSGFMKEVSTRMKTTKEILMLMWMLGYQAKPYKKTNIPRVFVIYFGFLNCFLYKYEHILLKFELMLYI